MPTVLTLTPNNFCPHCEKLVDWATGDRKPIPGDFSVCLYCAGINRFNDELMLVKSDLRKVPKYLRQDIQIFQEAVKKLRKHPHV